MIKANKEPQVRFRPHLEVNLEENWLDLWNENESKIDKNPPKTEKRAPQKSTFFSAPSRKAFFMILAPKLIQT